MLRATLKNLKSLTGCLWLLAIPWALFSSAGPSPTERSEEIPDVTGQYHFLSPDDTLAVLEEEGKLRGYVDVTQGEEESDVVLSFTITTGSRKKDRVEFKTSKIHQKYYRFAGAVQRGQGQKESDPDFLRLVGDVEVVTVKGGSGEEAVQRVHVVFKSLGKGEREEN